MHIPVQLIETNLVFYDIPRFIMEYHDMMMSHDLFSTLVNKTNT